jgi:hypothetical protein
VREKATHGKAGEVDVDFSHSALRAKLYVQNVGGQAAEDFDAQLEKGKKKINRKTQRKALRPNCCWSNS